MQIKMISFHLHEYPCTKEGDSSYVFEVIAIWTVEYCRQMNFSFQSKGKLSMENSSLVVKRKLPYIK